MGRMVASTVILETSTLKTDLRQQPIACDHASHWLTPAREDSNPASLSRARWIRGPGRFANELLYLFRAEACALSLLRLSQGGGARRRRALAS